MDLYKQLNLQPVRTEPDVWVRRLVIYEQITPEPMAIREILLTKGLNIVWAEEPQEDDPNAEITGHSAGKTTFCRLLRYVLGETTFGTRANVELIRRTFPTGYVAAELSVRGRGWAVVRPIGNGRNSYIKPEATIEELLADKSHPAYQGDFSEKLGLDAILDDMEAGAVPRTNQAIEWGHMLAWCTRDQEARFQNVHEWRSPRSESDWPAFRFPKADPLFVMRAVLGLFLPDELEGEGNLADLQRQQEEQEKRLEELKREPQLTVSLYDRELRRRLRAVLPDETAVDTVPLCWDLLACDLHRYVQKATEEIETGIASVEEERQALQEQIDLAGADIGRCQDELRSLAAMFDLESAALRELDEGVSKRQKTRRDIRKHEDLRCPFGGVLIRDCDYVTARRDTLQMTALQDAHNMEQAEARRAETQKALDKQKRDLEDEINRLTGERKGLQAKRDALWSGIRDKRDELRDLKRAEEQLALSMERQHRKGEFTELDNCQKMIEDIAKNIDKTKNQLTRLLEQHAENRELLASIFSGSVGAVLASGTYDGHVGLDDRELSFTVMHGPAMSGEAVETLSVLLADTACMVYTSVSPKSRLPGLLLHDSPREADLSFRIYMSFLRFVGALEDHFGDRSSCPFQYIVTTTTTPPKEFQETHIRARLNAAKMDGLLLRRSIALPPDEGADDAMLPMES